MIDEFFARHKVIVLQFSGGKDSLAVLHFLRPYWKKITVMWLDTGDSFPETRAQWDAIAKFLPRAVRVTSQQPENIEKFGPPTDLLPVWDSIFGRLLDDARLFKVQTPFECCSRNLWEPMADATRALGATAIIRGQRNSESKKGRARSGLIEDGMEYFFPLENWSEQQVRDFLNEKGVSLPENYKFFNSSLDCMQCTAYLAENKGKGDYLRAHYPVQGAIRKRSLDYILRAVEAELTHLQEAQL